MKIELAKSAGFCFGVNRAIKLIEEIIEKSDKPIYTLGPIIHNPQMIEQLSKQGVVTANSVEEIPENSIVVVRTHGISEAVFNQLKEKDVEIVNATCPYVSKIQQIAKKQSNDNKILLIAGDPTHPEVKGIMGYANSEVFVFNNLEELEKITNENNFLREKECVLVAQTTFSTKEWKKICEYIKNNYTNTIIFDTICSATDERQKDAAELARNSDLVIVIGGKDSSNTTKLYEICKELCSKTFHIETAKELPMDQIKKVSNIGITAGASTPEVIIKEVLKTMSEEMNVTNENENDVERELSFEEALDQSFKTLQNGDRVKGYVVLVKPNEIQVDLGIKQAGYITASEFSNDPNVKLEDMVKVGDEIEVQVVRLNDVEGTVMLSAKRVEAAKGFGEVVAAFKDNTVLNGTVTEAVNAGVIVNYKGTKIFIPASQSGVPKEGDLNTLIGENVNIKLLDIQLGGRRRKLIGSIKNASREARGAAEEKVFADIEIGKKYTGKVKSLTSFGAFVDLGGVDGMVHITELSWAKIKHPSEVLTVGETVEVYIKDFDPETKRISLGFKNAGENPFEVFKTKYNVGDVVDVTIVRIVPFGAFAEIIPGVDGLIHISQISNKRVNKVFDFIKIGEVVKAKITQIDLEKNKISLSMKALIEEEEETETVAEQTEVIAEVPEAVTEEVKEEVVSTEE